MKARRLLSYDVNLIKTWLVDELTMNGVEIDPDFSNNICEYTVGPSNTYKEEKKTSSPSVVKIPLLVSE